MAQRCFRASSLTRDALAEFISTFILMVFGLGCVAQAVLSRQNHGNILTISAGWAVGVTMGSYWAISVSGAHMNPAITLALAVCQRFPWRKLPVYVLAQHAGAFVASVFVYIVYYDALNEFDGGVRQILGVNGTAGIWATYPRPYLSTAGGFVDQVLGTALLIACMFAVTDQRNNSPSKGSTPIVIGMIVLVIISAFSYNCGAAINPARDLAPRFFTALAGWGWDVFVVCNYWAWVPVVAPLVGGIAGALIYIVLIDMHHPIPDDSRAALQEVKVDGKGIVKLDNITRSVSMTMENGEEEERARILTVC